MTLRHTNSPMIGPYTLPGDEPTPIGRGGSASVYRTVGPTGQELAVKVLAGVWDESDLRRFHREQEAMSLLTNVTGVVPLLDTGVTDDGAPYLVMPLYRQGSLDDRLDRSGPIPWPEALDLIEQVGATLTRAHERGVFHRDVKPANLLVGDDGTPHLADFGITEIADGRSLSTTAAHTPGYCAPESLTLGRKASGGVAVDVYGLGTTVWALIAGHTPFTDGPGGNDPIVMMHRVATEPIGDPGYGCPPWLAAVAAKATAKRPDDRYPSVAAMLDDIAADGAWAVDESPRLASTLAAPPEPAPALTDLFDANATPSATGGLAAIRPSAEDHDVADPREPPTPGERRQRPLLGRHAATRRSFTQRTFTRGSFRRRPLLPGFLRHRLDAFDPRTRTALIGVGAFAVALTGVALAASVAGDPTTGHTSSRSTAPSQAAGPTVAALTAPPSAEPPGSTAPTSSEAALPFEPRSRTGVTPDPGAAASTGGATSSAPSPPGSDDAPATTAAPTTDPDRARTTVPSSGRPTTEPPSRASSSSSSATTSTTGAGSRTTAPARPPSTEVTEPTTAGPTAVTAASPTTTNNNTDAPATTTDASTTTNQIAPTISVAVTDGEPRSLRIAIAGFEPGRRYDYLCRIGFSSGLFASRVTRGGTIVTGADGSAELSTSGCPVTPDPEQPVDYSVRIEQVDSNQVFA